MKHHKVIVIIGSTSGIGRAAALHCADQGYNLVLAARHEKELVDLALECQNKKVKAVAVKTDISKEEDIKNLLQQALYHFNRIDVWINNAAVAAYGNFEEVPTKSAEQVINTNVMGYIYGSRAAIKHFKQHKTGILINVSSVVGILGQPFSSYYAMSKFAVRGLCLTLQAELSEHKDIHVCCVMPATMDTPFFQHAANYTGRALKALSPAFDPNRVAQIFLKLIQEPKPEVFVGVNPFGMALLRVFFPHAFAKKWLHYSLRHHFKDQPSFITDGNLFSPMEGPTVAGGWR